MEAAKGVGVTREMIEKALALRASLDEVRGDVFDWCSGMGYELRHARIKFGAKSVLLKTLFGTIIGVKRGLPYKEEIASIAHEICHDEFHSSCIAYRELKRVMIEREEGQAEMFASLVVFPSLTEYETADEFIRTCGVSHTLAEMRLKFFEKYGW